MKTCKEKSFSILQEREFSVLSFKAFGTSCEVKFSPVNSHSPELISKEVVSWVNEFERRYSRYLPDSWLSQVNKSAGIAPVKLSRDDQPIIQAASFVYFQSQQTIDPSCLPLTQIWQNARASNVIPPKSVVEDAKALVNWQKVQHTENEIFLPSPGMGLDFGGFGKEYAVDLISAKLRASNYGNFLVNFGGDIFASGYANDNCTWKVGIENPLGESNPSYVVSLSNTGLATSGNYRRYFDLDGKRYGHTIDQRTGYPTIHSQLTASVVSPSCLKSGIIATTSLLLGKEKGMRLLESEWNAEGCIQSFESTLITSKFYNYLIYENPA